MVSITPGGFWNQDRQPPTADQLWFTPDQSGGSLSTGARLLQECQGPHTHFSVLGTTAPMPSAWKPRGRPHDHPARAYLHESAGSFRSRAVPGVPDGPGSLSALLDQSGQVLVADAVPAGRAAVAAAPTGPHTSWTVVVYGLQAGSDRVSLPSIHALPETAHRLPLAGRAEGIRSAAPHPHWVACLDRCARWRLHHVHRQQPRPPGEQMTLQVARATARGHRTRPRPHQDARRPLRAALRDGPVVLGSLTSAGGAVSRTLTAVSPAFSGDEVLSWSLPSPDAGLTLTLVSSFLAA